MQNLEVLNELSKSHIPEVKALVENYKIIQLKLETKEITLDEYNELVDDLCQLDDIKKEMLELEVVRVVMDVINTLKSLKATMSLI